MSKVRLEKLILLLDKKTDSKVLDISCGKGEPLIRLNELFNFHGTGFDQHIHIRIH